MSKTGDYRTRLRALKDWDSFILKESGLPGPRGNLELAQAVADEGDRALFERYVKFTSDMAPVNSPFEFLAFCGVVGLGRLVAEGDDALMANLRIHACDPRWRTREAVAMALQRLGDQDMQRLLRAMQVWANGTPLEQRAVAAGLCEPRLLARAEHARAVLKILDDITASLEQANHYPRDDILVLRKGLGYCWSVAVAALPGEGKPLMEKWLTAEIKDIQWIMRENLKKTRLVRMDPEWVASWARSA